MTEDERWLRRTLAATLFAAVCGMMAAPAAAQDSSLLQRGSTGGGESALSLENASLLYTRPEPVKTLELHDKVTVVINMNSRVLSEGDAETRKVLNFSSVLGDWIGFDGLAVKPDPQTEGDPTISGTLNNTNRSESDIETRNRMTVTVAASVEDVRPNGNLVIQGRREVVNNEEKWTLWVTGEIRREDVAPDGKVMDEDILDLRVFKEETGQVRDGYRRGWLQRMYDTYAPF